MKIENMILEIRELLNLTIEEFVWEIKWSSCFYYQKIINGTTNKKTNKKQKLIPSWDKVIVNINESILNNQNWKKKEKEIYEIMHKYVFYNFGITNTPKQVFQN